MIVELSQEEVRVCTQLATERWLTKFSSTDRPNYALGKAQGKLEHELLANLRANVSEWAVAKEYGLSWNVPWYPNKLHFIRGGLPDVGENGEVRTVRTATGIPFWKKDFGKIIFGTKILDEEYYTKVEVYGWFDPIAWGEPEYQDPAIQGWRVPIQFLRSKENV